MRLDKELHVRGLAATRSQAENLIRLGYVRVNSHVITKTGAYVTEFDKIQVTSGRQYVSRAALKLKSVSKRLKLNFRDAVVLDVGSSTGGFTEYALERGAKKVIAVDVGTDQLHPSLRSDTRIELHEKTDIRDLPGPLGDVTVVVMDVSFISLKEVLPAVKKLVTNPDAQIVAMMKPQFEAGSGTRHKGVIKNSAMRREIIKAFEAWLKHHFVIVDKADSDVSGAKGNTERFYLLRPMT